VDGFYNHNATRISDCSKTISIKIFDTTLRDGEQTPGVEITPRQKIKIADQLNKLGVDVIEAGFPSVSSGEATAIREMVRREYDSKVCVLARTNKKDIDAAIACGAEYVHTFIATSPIHMKYKLKMTSEQVMEKAVESVEYIKANGMFAEFSCEDATRSDYDFIREVYARVLDVGADVINVPDTLGVDTQNQYRRRIRRLFRDLNKPFISVHCHDDYGQATANTLAGIESGARQAHVTVNGIGERAGNAALEEVVMSLEKQRDGYKTNINMRLLKETCDVVQKEMGVLIAPNKSIVGENAFTHETGIHVHGMIANRLTYEPFNAELVGQKTRFVIGKHSGKHSIEATLNKFGYMLDRQQLSEITSRVKELGDQGVKVFDTDLILIAKSLTGSAEKVFVSIDDLQVVSSMKKRSAAHVVLRMDGEKKEAEQTGVGSVDAAINAISKASGLRLKLGNYNLDSISGGTDSYGLVHSRLSDKKGNEYLGRASSRDIVQASVLAYLDALNKYLEIKSLSKSKNSYKPKTKVKLFHN